MKTIPCVYYTKRPEKMIAMIRKINGVGLGKMRKYIQTNHPKENFERNLSIIRTIAKYGYTGAITECNISKGYGEQLLKRWYDYALDIERNGV